MNSDSTVPARDICVAQVAVNTCDLPGSLRLFHEMFGLRNAGASCLWGDIMRVQGLAPDARGLIWWMVGGAPFFQLEIFQHTRPAQRPLPADWRPCDHGWVRFGIAVNDFDRAANAARSWGLAYRLAASQGGGRRRMSYRDPFVGVVIEVLESSDPACPVLSYATSSVADLSATRHFYQDVIKAEIRELTELHNPADEALWGLAGAQLEGFLAKFGAMYLEVVSYSFPQGQTPSDRVICDQGIMNVALGSRDTQVIDAVIDRARAHGNTLTEVFRGDGTVGTYIVDPGCEIELLAAAEKYDRALGFAAAAPFLGELSLIRP